MALLEKYSTLPEKNPYLKTYSITDISWDKQSQEFYQNHAPKGLEFTNLNTLFGRVLKTGQAVISNDPHQDPRSGGNAPRAPYPPFIFRHTNTSQSTIYRYARHC